MPFVEVTGIQLDNQAVEPVSQPSGFVEVQNVQLDKPSFTDRARQIFQERGAEIERVTGDAYPEQTAGEDVLQTLGQVAGGAGELAGEALVEGAKFITPDPWEEKIAEKAQELVKSDVGQAGLKLIGEGVEAYDAWRQENPRSARNVESIVNVGLFGLPALKTTAQAGKGAGKAIGAMKGVPEPTLDDVVDAEKLLWRKAYDTAETRGTMIDAEPISNAFGFKFNKSLGKDVRVNEKLHPQTIEALDEISEFASKGSVDPQEIQITRRILNGLREKSRGEMGKATDDTRLLNDLIYSFDDAVDESIKNGGRMADTEVLDMFKEARRVSRIKYKAEILQDAFDRAEIAGSSPDRAIKSAFRRIANNDRKMKQFSKREAQAIRKAANTGVVEQSIRSLSIFDPTSGKLSGAIGLGTMGTTGNIFFPIMGMGARATAENVAKGRGRKAFREVIKALDAEKPPSVFTKPDLKAPMQLGTRGAIVNQGSAMADESEKVR